MASSETKTRALYNPNDGLYGRDGGPYLDQEETRIAEERRARIEGRKPDLENPALTAGTPLVTAGQLLANATVHSGSNFDNPDLAEDTVSRIAKDKDTALRTVVELPAEAFTPLDQPADLSMQAALMESDKPEKEDKKPVAKKAVAPKPKAPAKKAAAKPAAK